MLRNILIIGCVISFLLFVYGVYKHVVEVEPNACEMTYMFDTPQFKKLHVTSKEFFSNYGLYYYYEGQARVGLKSLNGAPVLFIPGNGGSYRQARSLASVALQMGKQSKNHLHLDYFTIDYNEELSAFYGRYLEKQKEYLQLCIKTIAKLYRKSTNETVKIAIVGHSMGGIVAKSVLCEENFAKHIESIIFLSTPLDRPVVNFDSTMNIFYEYSNYVLQKKRAQIDASSVIRAKDSANEVLLISIGGGVRDLQVPAWLTTSKYSNIHAMTSAIPKVWLSCDHLSIVWCLQLMKVINRFLFSILKQQPDNYVTFQHDFESKFQLAYKNFIGNVAEPLPSNQIDFDGAQNNDSWFIERNRYSYKVFKNGLQKGYNQLFPLKVNSSNESLKMYIEIVPDERHDWLYGCIAEEKHSGSPVCKKIVSLENYVSWIPIAKRKKAYALLNIQDLVKTNKDWTHILARLPASRKAVSLRYDVHSPIERCIHLEALCWLEIGKEPVVLISSERAAYVQLIIENVENVYFAIQLNLQKLDCLTEHGDITIKTSASWAKGFDEYHIFYANEREKGIIVNAPIENAHSFGKSASQNRVYVDIFLEPSCRLNISPQFSFEHSMRRIIQRFFACLPAHLTAAFIVILVQHSTDEDLRDKNIFKQVFAEFFQFESMLIAIICHILQPIFPHTPMGNYTRPLVITILLQGTAIIVSPLIALSVTTLLTSCAHVLMIIMPRLSSVLQLFSFPYIRTIFTFRLILGVVIVSISLATCCGIGLALTYFVYFLWLANVYKEILLKQRLSPVESEGRAQKEQNNFLLHFKLLHVLLMLASQNAVEILAWIIKYPNTKQLFLNTQTISIILMLISWTFFWEMEHLADLYNIKITSVLMVLYMSVAACFLFSQENIFVLNYVVAFVFISFLLLGSLYKLQ